MSTGSESGGAEYASQSSVKEKNARYCVTSTSLCALKIDNVRLIEPAVLSGHISQIFLSRNACRSYWVNVSKQIEITYHIRYFINFF